MEPEPEAFKGSVLTDAAIEQIKKQSPEGCLLCVLDAFEEEEWE